MHLNEIKRGLSFVIALVMVFLMVPVQAYASETGDQSSETHEAIPTETTDIAPSIEPVPEETHSNLFVSIQTQIDSILKTYLLTEDTSAEGISLYVASLDDDRYWDALIAVDELENVEDLAQLTEAEQTALIENNRIFSDFASALYARHASDHSMSLFTTINNILDGQISISDSANSMSNSNGTVTATAKGNLFGKKTNTINVYNNTDHTASISFEYSASTYNSFKINGSNASASGTYTAMLDAGKSVKLTLQSGSGLGDNTATLILSKFSITTVSASSSITFGYDSAYGSITVAGASVLSGSVVSVASTGATLVATPNSGATFHGWVNAADGSILSANQTYTLTPATDMTVKAIFLGSNSKPHFAVGGIRTIEAGYGVLGLTKGFYYQIGKVFIFDDLNTATDAASASTTNKGVVLMNNSTLPAGDYTIPAGVKLLIPFDSTNTMYTDFIQSKVPNDDGTGYNQPTAYRTLTMADGVNLTVDGELNLSAIHLVCNGAILNGGSPTDSAAFIKMQDGSSITVNNGGKLYAYGFITGDGAITAKGGSTVYENLQVMDFRGGTQTTDGGMKTNMVFPLSQYYIQNIEVPMTFEYNATEICYTTIRMQGSSFPTMPKMFGASGALFNITSGEVTKWYDGSRDRLVIALDGNMDVSSLEMNIGGTDISSSDYVLAINNNVEMNANANSNVTIKTNIAFQPGVQINIAETATATLGSGFDMYVYDLDDWGPYTSALNKEILPVTYAPGKIFTRTVDNMTDTSICVNGTLDTSAGYLYTTNGGANIHSTASGVVKINQFPDSSRKNPFVNGDENPVTYQLIQGSGYVAIPVAPAKLHNSDSSYVESGSKGQGQYTYINGFWHKGGACSDAAGDGDHCCDICGADGITEHTMLNGVCTDCGAAYEAQIGSTYYETLAKALDQVAEGATVTLLTNISGEITISQQVSIELGNYSANIQAGEGFTYAKNGTVITIGKAVLGIGAVNLRAGDSLDLFFYVKKTALANSGYTDFYAKIERTKGGTVQPAETISYAQWEDYNETYVRFCYDGIAAKEMTDSVTVTVYSADGKPLSSAYTDSVQGYAMRMIRKGSSSAALKTALVDMLNYGAAAQTHFGFNTSSLANALIESEGYSSLATKETPVCTKITGNPDTFYAGSVSVKNNLTFTFCFSGIDPDKIATATYTDHYGKNKTPSGTFYTLTDENGVTVTNGGQTVYGVDIEDIAIADGRQKITCTVTDVSGNEIQAISSVESYLAYAMEKYPDEDVFPMLAKFIDSAYAYFHQ